MPATLAQLKTRSYRRADKESDPHVGPSEATDLINEGYAELWDLLLQANEHYFDDEATFTIASGASTAALGTIVPSATVQKVVTVQRLGNGTTTYGPVLPQLMAGERGLVDELSWEVVGANIRFEPVEQAPGSYKMAYVPALTALVVDNDQIHSRIMPGWEEFIVCHAAAMMLGKEESSTKDVLARKDALASRIATAANGRSTSTPKRVADVRGARKFRFMSRSGYPVE